MRYLIDLHMHTIASTHAFSTIQEYVTQAKHKGIKIIAITDHGKAIGDGPHRWHFLNLRIVPRIFDGIGVLRGIEANILNIHGDIDCDKEMSNQLDIVLAGFHEPACASMGIDKNTEALIATIKNPQVHIISHPGNPNFPIHIDEIAEAAKKHHVALEINNSSFVSSRKGSEENCKKIALAVKKVGGIISLGSDSHIATNVGNFEHAINLIKAVDFPEEQIINRDVKTIVEFISKKTGKQIKEFDSL